MALTASEQFVYHHLIFPPDLPHEDDSERDGQVLTMLFLQVAQQFAQHASYNDRPVWRRIAHLIASWIQVYDGNLLCENKIASAISAMQVDGKHFYHELSFNIH